MAQDRTKHRLTSRITSKSVVILRRFKPPIRQTQLFRFLGGIHGPRDAPRIVFFLGIRDSFERRLVSLLVDLVFLLAGFLFVAAGMALALHLSVRRYCYQCQHHRRNREGLHRRSPWHSAPNLRNHITTNKESSWRRTINLLFSHFSNF